MLGRIALRIAAVQALKGRTLVAGNVLDSRMTALDIDDDGNARTDEDKPFISLYVDASRIEGGLDSRSLHKPGQTDFVIEIGVAAAMTLVDPATDESLVIPGIPATDTAFEFFLDVVGRQVVNALTDPGNEWAEIWRSLSSGIGRIERRRMTDQANGARIAAHQMVLTVDPLPDPVFGAAIADDSAWAKFFARAGTIEDPVLARMVGTMRSLVGTPQDLCADQQRRRFGTTLEEARALMDIAVPHAAATEPDIVRVTSETAEP